MRPNPLFNCEDPEVVRELVRANPWATLVSNRPDGLVASHYPVLLDEAVPQPTLLTHVGRPDDELHGFAAGGELLVIIQGRHGYISPSWYGEDDGLRVPTWNFIVAHCYGTAEILAEEENIATLARLTEHFEQRVAQPALFDPVTGPQIAKRTVGLRIPVTRFICKRKMSQNKSRDTRERLIAELRGNGPYADPALADEVERTLRERG